MFNSLRIIVEEAVVNEAAVVVSDRPELANLVIEAHPIESVEGCKMFQLSWRHYLAYLVTEELVGSQKRLEWLRRRSLHRQNLARLHSVSLPRIT